MAECIVIRLVRDNVVITAW